MPQYAPVIDLSTLNGTNGFRLDGIDGSEFTGDFSGTSVAFAGDVNGDGFGDIIIGAPHAAPHGEAYVIFGMASGWSASLDLSTLDGANGFRLDGVVGRSGRTGQSVASAGDVNGDGFADIIIGAPFSASSATADGETYVVFGKASGFAAAFDLSTLNGTNGFSLSGIDFLDYSGTSVASAGDVNGDGFADLIIGARGGDPGGDSLAGETYVVFGKASGWSANLNLAALDGTNGFRLDGIEFADSSGSSVASAGDVNGDGFDDIVIGAIGADGAIPNSGVGEAYVVFGKASGWSSALDLSTLDGTNGFQLDGNALRTGWSVASAGDVNGDGFDDILVSAYAADPGGVIDAGETYVVFGKASGWSASLDLSTLNGTNGFRLDGIDVDDYSGFSVASAGDVNGDGFDDIIIGAVNAFVGSGVGETYVVFGKAGGWGASLSLSALNGDNGFRLDGIDAGDLSGRSVSSARDVNGDGFADILIGAPEADPGGDSHAGETYVIFGSRPGVAVTRTGTAIANTINGGDFSDTLNGLGGDDTLIGWGSADTLNGDAGNDTLRGGGGADAMAGGGGNDTYVVDNAGDVTTESSALDGTDLVQSSVTRTLGANLENLTLTGSTAINGTGNALANILKGNAFANVLSGADGADKLVGFNGGDTLRGGLGFDRLTGGNGADKFVFDVAPTFANRDRITDFNLVGDVIQMDNAVFAGIGPLGALAAGAFRVGANAADATDRIIYNAANGKLLYDADGTGAGAQIHFATLDAGLALTAADFVVI